jgi:hypothetical protein
MPVSLTQFKDRLATWNVIAAMTVDKDEPGKSMLQKILRQTIEEIEIGPRIGGKGAGKIEVMSEFPNQSKGAKRAVDWSREAARRIISPRRKLSVKTGR